jgi:late competence protein required for DNA uptake (superfamily II DNA/RNA helicase)
MKEYHHCSVCGKHTSTIAIEKIGGMAYYCHDCFMKAHIFEGEVDLS